MIGGQPSHLSSEFHPWLSLTKAAKETEYKIDDNSTNTIHICSLSSLSVLHVRDYSSQQFQGACLDTGAETSVCGLGKAKAYCERHNVPLQLNPSNKTFRFGDHVYRSNGLMEFRIPLSPSEFLPVPIDVVDATVPLILGLDLLTREQLLVDYLQMRIKRATDGKSVPIVRKLGHCFLEWDEHQMFFTRSELQRLHYHFMHPTVDKLFALLKLSLIHI